MSVKNTYWGIRNFWSEYSITLQRFKKKCEESVSLGDQKVSAGNCFIWSNWWSTAVDFCVQSIQSKEYTFYKVMFLEKILILLLRFPSSGTQGILLITTLFSLRQTKQSIINYSRAFRKPPIAAGFSKLIIVDCHPSS